MISGVGKIFVGEIVETALDVMAERGEVGPIGPEHLREAFRRYQKRTGKVKNRLYQKTLLI